MVCSGSSAKTAFLVLCVLVFALASPGAAQPLDLAIVVAIDVSESVNAERYFLQHEGIARAFEQPSLVAAIGSHDGGAIAVLVLEWSDRDKQVVTVDWTRVANAQDAVDLAARIRRTRRTSHGLTAIGDALHAARAQFDRLPEKPSRRIIDISGDGMANIGPPPAGVRDALVAEGITINGLPILTEEPWLDDYYNQYVVGGPGAFLITAEDYQSFATAIAQKLLGEVAAVKPKNGLAHYAQSQRGAQRESRE
jgi:hypothetical protein